MENFYHHTLRSRWTIPCSWRCETASRIWKVTSLACSSLSGSWEISLNNSPPLALLNNEQMYKFIQLKPQQLSAHFIKTIEQTIAHFKLCFATGQARFTHISNIITISLCDSYTSWSCITPGWLTAWRIMSISVIISSLQLTARLRFLRNLAAYTHPVLLSVHFLTTANLPLYKPRISSRAKWYSLRFPQPRSANSLTCQVLVLYHSGPRLDLF